MIDDGWMSQKLRTWQVNDVPDDKFIVELENTLAAFTFESSFEFKEEAQMLRDLLRHGCFPFTALQQFCEGYKIDVKNLNQQLEEHSLKVSNSSVKAFIAQPFRNVSDSLYEQIIEPSCYWEIISPIRIDKSVKESNLIDKIQEGFDNVNLFIADLTDNNQNVFYEIGYFEAKKIDGLFLSPAPIKKLFYTQFKDIIQVKIGLNGVANARKELREALRKKRTRLAHLI